MQVQKKKKSLRQTGVFLTVIAKNRHFSTTNNLGQTPSKTVAEQIVEMLLDRAYQTYQKSELFYNSVTEIWDQVQSVSNSYFQFMKPQTKEVLCVPEDEPHSEQKKSIGVVAPPILKRTKLKTIKPTQELSMLQEESTLNAIDQEDKKVRDQHIKKLKKEYIAILQTKYTSESVPIEENKVPAKEKDSSIAEKLRSTLSNQIKDKKINKLGSRKGEKPQPSKQKQFLSTIYKKSKAFIDQIDPTNSAFKSQESQEIQAQNTPSIKRRSLGHIDFGFISGAQLAVKVKESNFREITNKVLPTKEVVNLNDTNCFRGGSRFSVLEKGEKQENTQKDEVKGLVKPKMKKMSNESIKGQVRIKNSISVCLLPKINRL